MSDREPSHAKPLAYYRDPLERLLAEEGRTCKGCVHEASVFDIRYCSIPSQRYGKRCKRYEERIPERTTR